MTVTSRRSAITLAVVNDHPIVVEGIARAVERDGRITVVETDTDDGPEEPVDLVLYDTFAAGTRSRADVAGLTEDPMVGKVVVFTWNLAGQQVDEVLSAGAHSCLSKELSVEELAQALVRIHGGERVVEAEPARPEPVMLDWPGRAQGLSPREAEMLALISQGHTNEQIAHACHLSINSVKTYIRSAYRKIGVERRSQAVAWGLSHGMHPRRETAFRP